MAKHVLTKLDRNAILAEADASGQVYRLKSGWRKMQIFAGILCCLLILGIPLGIWIIVAAKKARVALGKDGVVFKALGTASWAWNDIESFSLGNMHMNVGGGLAGALVGAAVSSAVSARTEGLRGPIVIKLKDRRLPHMLPAHQVENSVAMAREMERLSGLTIFPPAPEAAA
jgi:hypothetical protein